MDVSKKGVGFSVMVCVSDGVDDVNEEEISMGFAYSCEGVVCTGAVKDDCVWIR